MAQPWIPNHETGLSFGLRIRQIATKLEPSDPPPSSPDGYWLPPCKHEQFEPKEIAGYLLQNYGQQRFRQETIFKWSPGLLTPISPESLDRWQPDSVTSMFWGHDRHCFIHVEQDCTRCDVPEPQFSLPSDDEEEDGSSASGQTARQRHHRSDPLESYTASWKRISFHHEPHEQGCVSKVGYNLDGPNLLARMPEAWTDTLLPSTLQVGPNPGHHGFTQLIGRISTLIGMVAFNASEEHALNAIKYWFPWRADGSTNWQKHSHMQPPQNSQS